MKEDSYVRFNSDGSVEHVTETRSNRNLTADVIARIGSNVTRHVPNAFKSGDDRVGILVNGAELYTYKFMRVLNINSSFKVGEDKRLRPIYLSHADKRTNPDLYPQFVGKWLVPSNMRLMFACKVQGESDIVNIGYKSACFLIAWDDKQARRLPLPNLYDNCYMCMGEYNGRTLCIEDSFARAVEQLEKSEWNSDLLEDSRQKGSDVMFQFVPHNDQGMIPMPCPATWRDVCPVAGNAAFEILANAL